MFGLVMNHATTLLPAPVPRISTERTALLASGSVFMAVPGCEYPSMKNGVVSLSSVGNDEPMLITCAPVPGIAKVTTTDAFLCVLPSCKAARSVQLPSVAAQTLSPCSASPPSPVELTTYVNVVA